MSFFSIFKRPFSSLAYSLLSHASSLRQQKFSILMDLLSVDPRRVRKLPSMALDFLSMPDLETAFPDLDDGSLDTLRRFVASLHLVGESPHLYTSIPPYACLWSGICTKNELLEAEENDKRQEQLRIRYHLRHGKPSSLIYHHGLASLPNKALDYLKNTVFVDAGAFEGDSTLIFLQYNPKIIWAFEPTPQNRDVFRNTMAANDVPEKLIRLFSEGLSDHITTVRFAAHVGGNCSLLGKGSCKAKLIPLDSLKPPTRIGLIKADLEGMGMYMLRGAAETIRRDKPILTLNFYHNPDEFWNTYSFVRNLGIPYKYKVLSFYPPWRTCEVALLAWPAECS